MKIQAKKISVTLLLILLSGCVTSPNNMYYWGDYERLIHNMYINPGSVDPQSQITKLETILQGSLESGLQVPPGIFAHLGMLYAMQGDVEAATVALEQEKRHYPESSTLINGMLSRALKEVKE